MNPEPIPSDAIGIELPFGTAVWLVRMEEGLSQAAFANRVQLTSSSAVHKWESGAGGPGNRYTAQRIESALGIRITSPLHSKNPTAVILPRRKRARGELRAVADAWIETGGEPDATRMGSTDTRGASDRRAASR